MNKDLIEEDFYMSFIENFRDSYYREYWLYKIITYIKWISFLSLVFSAVWFLLAFIMKYVGPDLKIMMKWTIPKEEKFGYFQKETIR